MNNQFPFTLLLLEGKFPYFPEVKIAKGTTPLHIIPQKI